MLLISGITFCLAFSPNDSIGLKVENGRVFIIHEVDPGETLFGISQRYKVSIEDIRQYNTDLNWKLSSGQMLKIPRFLRKTGSATIEKEDTTQISTEQKPEIPKTVKKPVYYTVQDGDNLYNVSQKHGITVRQVIDFNKLESTLLTQGQQLVVGFREQTLTDTDEKPNITGFPSKDSISFAPNANIEPFYDPYRKKYFWNIQETGNLDTIQSNYTDPDKFSGLHNHIPEGTLVEIQHPTTKRSVYVKITGKLEDGISSDVILQVTDKTLRYLGFYKNQSMKANLYYRIKAN